MPAQHQGATLTIVPADPPEDPLDIPDPLLPRSLAPTLRALRAGAELSQRELAALAGVPRTTVARLESGEHNDPRLGTLLRIVRAAECDVAVVTETGWPLGAWVYEQARDRGSRHLPAHRDIRVVRRPQDWWGYLRESTNALPDIPRFTFDARLPRRRGHPPASSPPRRARVG